MASLPRLQTSFHTTNEGGHSVTAQPPISTAPSSPTSECTALSTDTDISPLSATSTLVNPFDDSRHLLQNERAIVTRSTALLELAEDCSAERPKVRPTAARCEEVLLLRQQQRVEELR